MLNLILKHIPDSLVAEKVNKVAVSSSVCTSFMGNNSTIKYEAFPLLYWNFNNQLPEYYFTTLPSPNSIMHLCIKDRILVQPVLIIFPTSCVPMPCSIAIPCHEWARYMNSSPDAQEIILVIDNDFSGLSIDRKIHTGSRRGWLTLSQKSESGFRAVYSIQALTFISYSAQ